MAKRLSKNQLTRMTAMFVADSRSNDNIAAAIGIAISSVSRYRRAFAGKIPMPHLVGRALRKYDLIKSYTPYVRPEAMTVERIDVLNTPVERTNPDIALMAKINEANRRSGLPEWESHAGRDFEEAEAELEKIDRELEELTDPIAAAIRKLEAEREKLSQAIETLKRLR